MFFNIQSRTLTMRVLFFLVIGYVGLSTTNAAESNASEASEEEKLLKEIDEILSEDTREPLPASVFLDMGLDSDSGKNYYSGLDLPVYDLRFLLSGGKNVSSNAVIDEEDSSTFYAIGLFSDARDKLGLGVEYRSWKFEEIVEINALRGTIELNYPDVSLSFTPQFRNIAFNGTLNTMTGPREIEIRIDSIGYNANLTVFLPADTWVSGLYASHIYNDEIGLGRSFFDLVRQEASQIRLSPGILNQTYGLEKNRTGLIAGIDFAIIGLFVRWSESVSAVDREKTTTTDGNVYWYLDKHWRLGFNGGIQSDSINSDQISFGNISIKYRF